LDKLLAAIGPKLERIRVEGAGTAEELSGPEPPFVVDPTTGKRIYVSPASFGMFEEAAKAPASPSPPTLPTFRELVATCREEERKHEAQAAARAAGAAYGVRSNQAGRRDGGS
jgi:hypothetical protein